MTPDMTCTAFADDERLASGPRPTVAEAITTAMAAGDARRILVFEDETGRQVDIDLRAPLASPDPTPPAEGIVADPARRAGRPRLGVVAREVTLLPRHWDWLAEQSGGASVTLRKLVDAARKADAGAAEVRRAREAADRFMAAMLGNRPHYEEASRALYAGDRDRFLSLTAEWPKDPRDFVLRLAKAAFPEPLPIGPV